MSKYHPTANPSKSREVQIQVSHAKCKSESKQESYVAIVAHLYSTILEGGAQCTVEKNVESSCTNEHDIRTCTASAAGWALPCLIQMGMLLNAEPFC